MVRASKHNGSTHHATKPFTIHQDLDALVSPTREEAAMWEKNARGQLAAPSPQSKIRNLGPPTEERGRAAVCCRCSWPGVVDAPAAARSRSPFFFSIITWVCHTGASVTCPYIRVAHATCTGTACRESKPETTTINAQWNRVISGLAGGVVSDEVIA